MSIFVAEDIDFQAERMTDPAPPRASLRLEVFLRLDLIGLDLTADR